MLLASEFGRDLTQHCSLAVWDVDPPYDGIPYRSRHDLTEWCWAVYDRVEVRFAPAAPLSPFDPDHRAAVEAVADLWSRPSTNGPPDSSVIEGYTRAPQSASFGDRRKARAAAKHVRRSDEQLSSDRVL